MLDEIDRRFTQEKSKASDASSATGGLSLEALVDIQRKTVADPYPIRAKQKLEKKYRTLTPHHEDSY